MRLKDSDTIGLRTTYQRGEPHGIINERSNLTFMRMMLVAFDLLNVFRLARTSWSPRPNGPPSDTYKVDIPSDAHGNVLYKWS